MQSQQEPQTRTRHSSRPVNGDGHPASIFVNTSNEMLRKRGYRLTPQRYMILSVIQEAEEHLSVDQITERVQKSNPFVSLSTIYRTLELLRELGLVRENHFPGEQPRYEVAAAKTQQPRCVGRVRMLVLTW